MNKSFASSKHAWWRFVCFSVLLTVWTGRLAGQHYRFEVYQQSEGLKNLQIHEIAFDKDGFFGLPH